MSRPEWTDHNQHDPGISLLQLSAYAIGALVFTAVAGAAIARFRTRRQRPD